MPIGETRRRRTRPERKNVGVHHLLTMCRPRHNSRRVVALADDGGRSARILGEGKEQEKTLTPWSQLSHIHRALPKEEKTKRSSVIVAVNTFVFVINSNIQPRSKPPKPCFRPTSRQEPGSWGTREVDWESCASSWVEERWIGRAVLGRRLRERWGGRAVLGRGVEGRCIGRAMLGRGVEERWIGRAVLGRGVEYRWIGRAVLGRGVEYRWIGRAVLGRAEEEKWIGRAVLGRGVEYRWIGRAVLGRGVEYRWIGRAVLGRGVEYRWIGRAGLSHGVEQRWIGELCRVGGKT
ncbi:hypothetical protein NDU88_005412 [Pleurodeles waltl]|uniref:Uncharacterized protein n=1 Tax=Pleurodeles waltl TaxID=8319 RepID=A0AAV7L4S6_PLEWA|nr:hypothetical protein NDU88_005412 [Pleurodeles waltl]